MGAVLSLLPELRLWVVCCKGPFILHEVGGAGGIWGGHPKENGLKEGPSKKKREKGGLVRYFSSALRWDTFYYS